MVTNERPMVGQDVIVHDVTGEEDEYELDVHGFQLHRRGSKIKDLSDEEAIQAEYFPEAEELLREM
jgi:hypothetical protein